MALKVLMQCKDCPLAAVTLMLGGLDKTLSCTPMVCAVSELITVISAPESGVASMLPENSPPGSSSLTAILGACRLR